MKPITGMRCARDSAASGATAVAALVLCYTSALAGVPTTTTSAFWPALEYEAGGVGTLAIASADIDRDGYMDLAVANNDSDNIGILFGRGNGTFETPLVVPTLSGPSAIQVADVNHDGRPDLVVAHDISDAVVAFLQRPELRAFDSMAQAGTGEGPESLALADFDSDGLLDAATANFFDLDGTISILRGLGDGTFRPAISVNVVPPGSPLLASPIALVAHDINNDGRFDLVVANSDGDNVAIIAGNGDGSFQEPLNFTVGSAPVSVAVSDLNSDGVADIVTADEEFFGVSVLLGGLSGTTYHAASQTVEAVGAFPEAVTTGDFNLDGRLDIAVANSVGATDGVTILRGNGNGSFQPPEDFTILGSAPIGIAAQDFNADGRTDLATANLEPIRGGCPLNFYDDNTAPGEPACAFVGTWNGACGGSDLSAGFLADGGNTVLALFVDPRFFVASTRVLSPLSANITSRWIQPDASDLQLLSGDIVLRGDGNTLVVDPAKPPLTIDGCPFDRYTGRFVELTAGDRTATLASEAGQHHGLLQQPRELSVSVLINSSDLSAPTVTQTPAFTATSALPATATLTVTPTQVGTAETTRTPSPTPTRAFSPTPMLTHISTPTPTASRRPSPQPGDINRDGKANADDLRALIHAIFTSAHTAAGDVNTDARVSAADVPALLYVL